MYVNSTLGKTPKFLKKIDRGVRDAGKTVDRSVRSAAEDVSAQYKRDVQTLQKPIKKSIRLIVPEGKTPDWIKAPEREVKRTAKKALPAASAYAGYIYGGPLTALQAAIFGKSASRPKGQPGSIERQKYHDEMERAQKFTAATTAAAVTVAAGAAAAPSIESWFTGTGLTTAASQAEKVNKLINQIPKQNGGGTDIVNTASSAPDWLIPAAIIAGLFLL